MSTDDATSGFGTLAYALLGLIADEPMNGYDLTRAFDLSLGNVWTARHSQIYPELGKLERAGFIEVIDTGPRRSKIYGATAAGRAAMRRWLQTGVPRATRNESTLRLFFLWQLEPDEAVALLRREEEHHRAQLARYRDIVPLFPPQPDRATRWSRIMLESGLRYEELMVEWTRWAAAALRELD